MLKSHGLADVCSHAFITEWDSQTDQEEIGKVMAFLGWDRERIQVVNGLYLVEIDYYMTLPFNHENVLPGYSSVWFTAHPCDVQPPPAKSLVYIADGLEKAVTSEDRQIVQSYAEWMEESSIAAGFGFGCRTVLLSADPTVFVRAEAGAEEIELE